MAKKQLRSVKKASETGRLSRDAVRSAVISVRDGRIGQFPSQTKNPHNGGGRANSPKNSNPS